MHTDPLTASRYPDTNDGTNIAQYFQNAVYDLAVNTCPRFATTAARDSAYAAYVSAGGTLANGRSCWTDDAGYWDRIGGAWVARRTSGTLSLVSGWDVVSGYHAPTWYLSSDGWVTLSGATLRTAANFALGTGTLFQFANVPAAIAPSAKASPGTGWVLVGSTTAQVFPCRIHVEPGSSYISVIGMDSGTGTVVSGVGIVNFDGVRYHI